MSIFLFLLSFVLSSPPMTGLIVGITDGDTVRVLVGREVVRVRIAEIDAPERTQPFGSRSKQALARRIFGRIVTVTPTGSIHRGRTIASVTIGGEDVAQWLVAGGWAWNYPVYSRRESLAEAEKRARRSRIGLWIDDGPVPPWEFRKRRKD